MRHPYIKKAKKNSHLMDLIDRYKKWRLTRGDESETDSGGESGGDNGGDDSDTDWNMTVKGPPPPAYIGTGNSTDSIGYSEPYISNKVGNGDLARDSSPVKDVSSPVRDPGDRSSRSPSKDVRGRSPEKQIIPTGLSPAKSEQQIVSANQIFSNSLVFFFIASLGNCKIFDMEWIFSCLLLHLNLNKIGCFFLFEN